MGLQGVDEDDDDDDFEEDEDFDEGDFGITSPKSVGALSPRQSTKKYKMKGKRIKRSVTTGKIQATSHRLKRQSGLKRGIHNKSMSNQIRQSSQRLQFEKDKQKAIDREKAKK